MHWMVCFEDTTDVNRVRFVLFSRQVMSIPYLSMISRSSYEGLSAIHFRHNCVHRLHVVGVVLPSRGNATPHVPCSEMALPLLTLVIPSSVFVVWRSDWMLNKIEVQ